VTAAKQHPNGGNCYGSTQQLQQHQVSKRLPTADHPRNAARITASKSERVFSAALPPQALSYTPDNVLGAFAKKARRLNFVL